MTKKNCNQPKGVKDSAALAYRVRLQLPVPLFYNLELLSSFVQLSVPRHLRYEYPMNIPFESILLVSILMAQDKHVAN